MLRSAIVIFASLAVASVGVPPTHDSAPQAWDLSWIFKCGISLEGQTKCAPDTVTGIPTSWTCDGNDGTWKPTRQPCKHHVRRDEAPSTPDGGWHIGCDKSGHCGYYQEHSGKRPLQSRSISSSSKAATIENDCDENQGRCVHQDSQKLSALLAAQPDPRELQAKQYTLQQTQAKLAQSDHPVFTRCEPLEHGYDFVQYLHPSAMKWIRFYDCRGHCIQFPDFASCEQHGDKYVVPMPPVNSFSAQSAARRHEQSSVIPQERPENSPVPDFHTVDTRCNPHNLSEVQRYNGSDWVHHYSCTFSGSCIDVDGHGACRLYGNVYELPSADRNPAEQEQLANPLRVRTTCNKLNASEVLQWRGDALEHLGVCIPPYECFDFSGGADYALCVHPDAQYGKMWLPWPSLSRNPNSDQVTRCRDESTLEQFRENTWTLYKKCLGVFKCRDAGDGMNSGCAAPSLYDILAHGRGDAEKDAYPDASIGLARLGKNDRPLKSFTETTKNLVGEVEHGVVDILHEAATKFIHKTKYRLVEEILFPDEFSIRDIIDEIASVLDDAFDEVQSELEEIFDEAGDGLVRILAGGDPDIVTSPVGPVLSPQPPTGT